MNLELFPPPPEPPREFFCHIPVDRSDLDAFIVVIRAPGDPNRRVGIGQRDDKAPHRMIAKTPVGAWMNVIEDHLLADQVSRTFNRIAVELVDCTADTVFDTNFESALWALVEAGKVEHTMDAPVMFRAARCDCG